MWAAISAFFQSILAGLGLAQKQQQLNSDAQQRRLGAKVLESKELEILVETAGKQLDNAVEARDTDTVTQGLSK
jgi:hypothetical protein